MTHFYRPRAELTRAFAVSATSPGGARLTDVVDQAVVRGPADLRADRGLVLVPRTLRRGLDPGVAAGELRPQRVPLPRQLDDARVVRWSAVGHVLPDLLDQFEPGGLQRF